MLPHISLVNGIFIQRIIDFSPVTDLNAYSHRCHDSKTHSNSQVSCKVVARLTTSGLLVGETSQPTGRLETTKTTDTHTHIYTCVRTRTHTLTRTKNTYGIWMMTNHSRTKNENNRSTHVVSSSRIIFFISLQKNR